MKLRAGFIVETDLGHGTYAQNLRASIAELPDIDAQWTDIHFGMSQWQRIIPVFSTNWTVRAGLRARTAYQKLRKPDVVFIHTQVLAVLCQDLMLRTPTVISLDATPLQYDSLGDAFGHQKSRFGFENIKWRLNQSAFNRARHIVTWTEAARESVIQDYRISHSKVSVVRPGIDLKTWTARDHASDYGPAKILFVGGDFFRKGGPLLVEAFRSLPDDGAELHIVTQSEVQWSAANVYVHKGLAPNSPELMKLFRGCNIFAFPTNGDFYPQAILEASGMGLAIVATDVGSISEIVRQDVTGLLIGRGDVDALAAALRRLHSDPQLRHSLGAQARSFVRTSHEIKATTERLSSILNSASQ